MGTHMVVRRTEAISRYGIYVVIIPSDDSSSPKLGMRLQQTATDGIESIDVQGDRKAMI